MQGSEKSPFPFPWNEWYASAGGRKTGTREAEEILEHIRVHQYPQFEGAVNPSVTRFGSPGQASDAIQRTARQLGADAVGIARVGPEDIYRDRDVQGSYAVVVLQHMNRDSFSDVPSSESALECLRVYLTLGSIVIRLANHIRNLGYPCAVGHPLGDSDVLHVGLAVKAGLGEQGRHGSLVRRGMGSLFRLACVVTDLPLAVAQPADGGQATVCDRCNICGRRCPAGAIPRRRSPDAGTDPFGRHRFMVDTAKCFPHFANHHYCSVCIAVCPVGIKGSASE